MSSVGQALWAWAQLQLGLGLLELWARSSDSAEVSSRPQQSAGLLCEPLRSPHLSARCCGAQSCPPHGTCIRMGIIIE